MDWTLEVVVLPVSDLDRAIAFYRDQVGFHLDHDTRNEHMHVAQLTPTGLRLLHRHRRPAVAERDGPGLDAGLQLVVADAAAAREELVGPRDRGRRDHRLRRAGRRHVLRVRRPRRQHLGRAAAQGARREAADPAGPPGPLRGVAPQRSRIAVTPWPPAAQIEMTPRPEPFSASSLASVATIRPPVAANGCPAASDEPATLSLRAVDRAERRVEAQPLLAEDRVLPRLERREHLRGERLVDLVEVEVLQRPALARRASAAWRTPEPSAGPRRRARSRRRPSRRP